jgi:hypothetical protein
MATNKFVDVLFLSFLKNASLHDITCLLKDHLSEMTKEQVIAANDKIHLLLGYEVNVHADTSENCIAIALNSLRRKYDVSNMLLNEEQLSAIQKRISEPDV